MTDRPITHYLSYLVAQANRQLSQQLDAEFRDEGANQEQWRILQVLSDRRGRSMGELADLVLMNHPTLTKLVDRMVSDTLVYRVADPADRRRVLLFISDRGQLLHQRLTEKVEHHQETLLAGWDDAAAGDLKKLLAGLIEKTGS